MHLFIWWSFSGLPLPPFPTHTRFYNIFFPPVFVCSCLPCYNQLFRNHLMGASLETQSAAVQGIVSINVVRLPWRQIA